MLTTEQEYSANGFVLYRDYEDPYKFYYLPSTDVRIGDNGTKLHYTFYRDSKSVDGNTEFEDGKRMGGFLDMEVELGPNEGELSKINEALKTVVDNYSSELTNYSGDKTLKIVPVPFKDGEVKLTILANDGEGTKTNVTIAGSTKPSLFGKQTAVFSAQLGSMEAEIILNTLQHKANEKATEDEEKKDSKNTKDKKNEDGNSTKYTARSQFVNAAVNYRLDFLGIMPAHNLKVKVNYNAVDDYIKHTFHTDADLDYEGDALDLDLGVNVDVDALFRDLVDSGAIEITHIDYTGEDKGSPLANDPTAMSIVKQLLSCELFEITPLPEEYAGASKTDNVNKILNSVTDTASKIGSMTQSNEKNSGDGKKAEEEKGDAQSNKAKAAKAQVPNPESVKAEVPKAEDTNEPSGDNKAKADAGNGGAEEATDTNHQPTANQPTNGQPTDDQNSKTKVPKQEDGETPVPDKQDPKDGEVSKDVSEGSKKSPESVPWKLNANLAYTYKQRKVTEDKVRTYIFNKSQAQLFSFYAAGSVVPGEDFDPDAQIVVVELGTGEAREITLHFNTKLSWDDYHIKEIIIDFDLGPGKDSDQVVLTKDEPRASRKFFMKDFENNKDMKYTVRWIFDDSSIFVGTGEYKPNENYQGFATEAVSKQLDSRSIFIDESHLGGFIPVEITRSVISFEPEDGFEKADVILTKANSDGTETELRRIPSSQLEKGLNLLVKGDIINDLGAKYFYQMRTSGGSPVYQGVPCSASTLTVNAPKTATKSFDLASPSDGFVKMGLVLGADTFDVVEGLIYVKIEATIEKDGKDGKDFPIIFTKNKPQYLCILNEGEVMKINKVIGKVRNADNDPEYPQTVKEIRMDSPDVLLEVY